MPFLTDNLAYSLPGAVSPLEVPRRSQFQRENARRDGYIGGGAVCVPAKAS